MDLRFAILASIVAVAGHVQDADGRAYSPSHFIQNLHKAIDRHDAWVRGELDDEVSSEQHVKSMMTNLKTWFSGINRTFHEAQGKTAISNLSPGASRQWLAQRRARSST